MGGVRFASMCDTIESAVPVFNTASKNNFGHPIALNMAETLEEVLEPFISVQSLITAPMITLTLMFFIYGLYVLIFGACVRILYYRKGSPNRALYLGGSTVLFALVTISTGFWTLTYIRQSILGYSAVKTQDYVPFVMYVQGDKLKTATYVVVSI
ncbi:hypothetical protein MPER_10849, partial [Moniliophthora perniciosa FA553]